METLIRWSLLQNIKDGDKLITLHILPLECVVIVATDVTWRGKA